MDSVPPFSDATQSFVGTVTRGDDLVVQYEATTCDGWPSEHFQVFERGRLVEWAAGTASRADLVVHQVDGHVAGVLPGNTTEVDALSDMRVRLEGGLIGFPPFDLRSPTPIDEMPDVSIDIYYERTGSPVGTTRYVEEIRHGTLMGCRPLMELPPGRDHLCFRSSYQTMLRYRAGEIDLIRAAARGRASGPPDLLDLAATVLESSGYLRIVRSSLGVPALRLIRLLTGHVTSPAWAEAQRSCTK